MEEAHEGFESTEGRVQDAVTITWCCASKEGRQWATLRFKQMERPNCNDSVCWRDSDLCLPYNRSSGLYCLLKMCGHTALASFWLLSVSPLSLGGESYFHVKENCFQTNAGRRSTLLNVSIIVLTGATSNKGSPIFKFPSHKTFLDEDVSKSRDVRLIMHVAMSFYRCCVFGFQCTVH